MEDTKEKVGIDVKCWRCEGVSTLHAVLEDIWSWQDGELIQNAMPYLSATERELLISRTCDSCWDKMFT